MSEPFVKGQSAVHLHSSSGRIQVSERRTKTIVKQGAFSDLEELLPKKGATFDGLRVVTAELSPEKGGMGLLTVTVQNPTAASGGGDDDPPADEPDEILCEVEMAQLEKPLMSHPSFSAYAGQIELWRGADPALRAAMKYTGETGETLDLQGNALKAARLILKGVESYLLFAPVCRRTTRISAAASEKWSDVGGDAGKLCAPPAACLAMVSGSWQWLKTADRAVETSGGGAERVEEWTGSDEWSQDLYETVNGGGSGGEGGEA